MSSPPTLRTIPARLHVTPRVVRHALTSLLGFEYGKLHSVGPAPDPRLLVRFLVELSDVLELEKAGTHVICFTDESYINEHYTLTFSYYNKEEGSKVRRPPGKGKRLCFIHCITKDGLLVACGEDGVIVPDAKCLRGGFKVTEEDIFTCELVFRAADKVHETADFHCKYNL